MAHPWQLRRAVQVLRGGGLIAYPTEGVYGLGCDPLDAEAVTRLLDLKGRPMAKGLILIAAALDALEPYLLPLSEAHRAQVERTWPGAVTWLLPARPECPAWLRGAHDTLAVRVPGHAEARALCAAFGGALVSTSANRAGHRPATSPLGVRLQFGARVDYILHAPLGGRRAPSEIRDLRTGEVLRAG
ncbi:threonylcarbamoyl-AMP synthase [Ectothiorhodospiraceae bacterium 2226]|nr:threonylcarbamoyl-AMP synthase [Ectothiorhodospiraceae bacterium 2226]